MRASFLIAASAATFLTTARAEADDESARRLFAEAVEASERGDWDEATAKYKASLAQKRAPITLYSLGVALREAGRHIDAWHHFRAFLAEPFDGPKATVYRKAAAEALDEMTHAIGRVVVVAEPASAEVSVDGEPCLAASEPCVVMPGRHRVVASAKGFVPVEREVAVAAGETETVSVTLAEASTPLWPLAFVGGGAAVFGAGVGLAVAGMKGDEPHVGLSVAGDVLIGAGLGAAAVGAVFLVVAPSFDTGDVALAPWTNGEQLGVAGRF
ncbi:MAG TPA: PEGA domain-containing protein [Polyangiaceae bacterium]|nr:PEGA domain-containing protein [Polyangiaceae bacterium]